jgi:hypothetical protein
MLPEVVAHICLADKCSQKDARRNLLKALADDVLGPLRWDRGKGDKPRPFGNVSIPAPSDTPPRGREWLTAKIRWKTGRVRDDCSGKWRVPLILHWWVSQHWPLAKPSAAAAMAPVARQTTKRRRRPAQEAASVELLAEYPTGLPNRADEPDAMLVDKIERRLKKKFGEKFSPKKDSILRAAGRRE